MEDIIKKIIKDFNGHAKAEEKRTGIFQLYLPIYHEDGDMIDLFIVPKKSGFLLCDYGMTLQRLGYSYDIDTPNKESIFQKNYFRKRTKRGQRKYIFRKQQREYLSEHYAYYSVLRKDWEYEIF